MKTTVTIHMNDGSVSEPHNMRDIDLVICENIKNKYNMIDIDNELGDSFHEVIYRSELKVKYAEIFGDALDKYNAKQKRKDRKMTIDDYMQSIINDTRGKRPTKRVNGKRVPDYSKESGKRLSYEVIVGVGNTERARDKDGKVMYDENDHHVRFEYLPRSLQLSIVCRFCEEFQPRNPNFRVVNIDVHGDEAFLNSRGVWEYGIVNTHIEFIPVAEGFKTGLDKQNSMNKALKAMGIKNGEQGIYDQWCKREQKRLEEITYEMYADYCAENPDYYRENGDIHIYHPVTEKRRKGGDEKEIFAREQELAEREANVSADERERDIALIALNQVKVSCEREDAQRKKKLDEQEENNRRVAAKNILDAEKNKLDEERNRQKEFDIELQLAALYDVKNNLNKEFAQRKKKLDEQEENNRLKAERDEERIRQKESEINERVQAHVKAAVEKIIAEAKADGDYQKANNFQKRLDKTMDLTKNIDTDSEKKIDTSRYDKF